MTYSPIRYKILTRVRKRIRLRRLLWYCLPHLWFDIEADRKAESQEMHFAIGMGQIENT